MNFQIVKTALVDLLVANQGAVFTTVGHQRQKISPERAMVTVFYHSGDFPKASGTVTSTVQHEASYRVEVVVSCPSKIDLSVIDNPAATPAALAAALAATKVATGEADGKLDTVFSAVWDILMNPVNYDIGLAKGTVANRWVNQVQKDEPLNRGSLVVLTGVLIYSVRMAETPSGEVPVPSGGIMDTTVDIYGDNTEKTGVQTGV